MSYLVILHLHDKIIFGEEFPVPCVNISISQKPLMMTSPFMCMFCNNTCRSWMWMFFPLGSDFTCKTEWFRLWILQEQMSKNIQYCVFSKSMVLIYNQNSRIGYLFLYLSLYNNGLHNKMTACNSLHATHIEHKQSKLTLELKRIHTHTHIYIYYKYT